jgi:hypothetical protein
LLKNLLWQVELFCKKDELQRIGFGKMVLHFCRKLIDMKKKNFLLILMLAFATVSFAQRNTKEISSDILTSWMELHCKMVKSSNGIAHVAYSRHFVYTAIAAYESIVAGSLGYRSLVNQLNGLNSLPEVPKERIFWPASLNASYADMLRSFYGPFASCSVRIDSMEQAQENFFLTQHISQKEIDKSTEYGKAIATAIIQWAATDNSNSTKVYVPLKGEGVWVPASKPAAPFFAENRSITKDLFGVYSLKQPIYSIDTTKDFYKMANEVYITSVNLTPEQKATALYWDDSPNGKYMTAFGHWTSITCSLIKQRHFSLIRAAEAYAKMTIAMHEASILAWKGKYQYNVLRPITYIQQNINKQWTPLIGTPPHPEFPAAHSTISSAAATALCSLFGEACHVTDNSYIDIGMQERSYSSLQDVAKEAGISRLYGGIHYRYSIEQGFDLGAITAKHVDQSIRFHK